MSRFAPGAAVCVADLPIATHNRVPDYIKHRRGTIEQLCGAFRNPEDLALGRRDGPLVPLYRVRFRQSDVWPNYRGDPADTLDVELFEHWLEPAP
jgi:nitrile hydratase